MDEKNGMWIYKQVCSVLWEQLIQETSFSFRTSDESIVHFGTSD